MFRPHHHLAALVLFAAVHVSPTPTQGRSQDAAPPFAEWLIGTWQKDEGLPQNSITALLQSHAGYLWIGTFHGLARFDGAQFTVFDPENTPALRSGRVTSLFEDADGALWVGQDTGDLAVLRSGGWESVRLPSGWPSGAIRSIQSDSSGVIWLLHPSGLLMNLSTGVALPASRPAEYAAPYLVRDRSGVLWMLRDRSVSIVRDDSATAWTPPQPLASAEILAIAGSARGGLWLVVGGRVRRYHDGAFTDDLGSFEESGDDPIQAIAELSNGDIVIATIKRGLLWFSAGMAPRAMGRMQGLAHDWTRRLLEDREGNLWVGTAGGLNRLRRRRAAMAPDIWNGTQVRTVNATPAGDLWVGTEGAGLHALRAGPMAPTGPMEGIPDRFIWSTVVDRTGGVWAGTWGQGLFRQDTNDRFAPAPGWPIDATIVTALYESRDGLLWAGTDRGLLCHSAAAWSWVCRDDRLTQVRTIAEDSSGNLWCGMSGGGLARIQSGKLTVFRKTDGLPSDFVWTIDPEPDGSLWIGTFGGGLCQWKDDRFAVVSTPHGLPSNVICHLADEGDDYWISSYSGIFRANKAALQQCADGKERSLVCLTLTRSDGLATLECSGGFQPAGTRTQDGRLWFPTAKGLAVIEPRQIVPQTIPPPVVIEAALIDDRVISAQQRIEVPPGRHRLEFRFAGICLATPERVRFRCRLGSFDRDWGDPISQRSVTYNYLPPGQYTFQVLACNGDGLWSPEPASLEFNVLPQFWQTWWFRLGAVATTGMLLLGAYQLRMRQIREIQTVRYRIARDLHDEVGANLGSIALLSQAVEQQPNAADAGELRRIATRTVEMLKEVVWLTNPAYDRLSQLIPRMRETARQMLPRLDHEFVTEDLPADLVLPPSWRHHLLPILKEALHNAARHAQATSVWVVLRSERNRFELRVEDNGCGFDPDAVIPGDGLLNLQRRAREMKASLRFSPRPGGGTMMQLVVNIP